MVTLSLLTVKPAMKSHARPPRAATLHDVAREAGVSLITASRALSNPGVVSDATIERVRAAVARTGYIPNLLAGGLKSKRSMTVAGLVPVISVPQFLPTVRALTETLDAAGYQLILGQTGYANSREEKLINTMIGRRPDGMVVTGLVNSPTAREQLKRLGIPIVEMWDLSDRPLDMVVGFSHVKVGSTIAGFFLAKGWRRFGVATGDDHRAMTRCEGFRAVVGRDIAICGFGDADFAAHLVPSLTTVQVDGAAIGRRAAQLIIDRCAGKTIAQPIIDVGFRIVERESTGAVATRPLAASAS
jgi:LacI family gluconate utilization system Gnt-I transcriptional repressor